MPDEPITCKLCAAYDKPVVSTFADKDDARQHFREVHRDPEGAEPPPRVHFDNWPSE